MSYQIQPQTINIIRYNVNSISRCRLLMSTTISDIEVIKTFLTGSITFLAIFPAGISIVLQYYREEFRIGTWKSVRWLRRLVWLMIFCLWLVVSSYLFSVFSIIEICVNITCLIEFTLYDMIVLSITSAALILAVSFTTFTLIVFRRDDPRPDTPILYFL